MWLPELDGGWEGKKNKEELLSEFSVCLSGKWRMRCSHKGRPWKYKI